MVQKGITAIAMERIPRISRAQAMDALSSQSNIAGYRAVIEAAAHYGRFLPVMMTAAGSAKPARAVVLGAGVAGLQAIATARRLGADVYAYDVRPETREQILSLGAKTIELDIGESGSGEGGYAKELSEEARQRQQEQLSDELAKAHVIITTALIPCRPAPVLIPAGVVERMREGSVIVDLAAATGGNCELTEKDAVVTRHGVIIVGHTNYPAMVASDASAFYAQNLFNLLGIMVDAAESGPELKDLKDDEITVAAMTGAGAA
jgi:NAD(P) transhydrogenase subunit alpha